MQIIRNQIGITLLTVTSFASVLAMAQTPVVPQAVPAPSVSPSAPVKSAPTTKATVTPVSAAIANQPANQPASQSSVSLPTPQRFLDDQEVYAVESQRLANTLAKLGQEEAIERLTLQLRNLRGEGRATGWGMPTVIGIGGVDGRLTAKLSYPGRGMIYARTGDALPNDWRVVTVGLDRIVVRKPSDTQDQVIPLVLMRGGDAPAVVGGSIPVDSAGPIVNRR